MGQVNDAFDNKTEISGEFGDNMSVSNVPAVINPELVSSYGVIYNTIDVY